MSSSFSLRIATRQMNALSNLAGFVEETSTFDQASNLDRKAPRPRHLQIRIKFILSKSEEEYYCTRKFVTLTIK
jgi:hypothetical protein